MSRSSISRLAVLGLVVAGLLIAWKLYERGIALRTSRIGEEIQANLKQRNLPEDALWRDRRTLALLRSFYVERNMRPAWTSGRGSNGEARDLAEVISRSDGEALDPENYGATNLNQRLSEKTTDPSALAELDLLCTIAALHYMSDMFDGRISPRALDAKWVTTPRQSDLDSLLSDALDHGSVKQALVDLEPEHDQYRKLRDARARYAKIVADGGWPELPAGSSLKKDERDPRVAVLRKRLVASGDLSAKHSNAADADLFDADLVQAVERIQRRYGKNPDGVVGETERAALNISAEERLRQIELNMERWRWLPKSFGDQYVLVNVPEYLLRVMDQGKQALEMRVVVGKVDDPTPVFSDSLKYIVINPDWNVPDSIVLDEIIPAMQEDPEYLLKNHMRIFTSRKKDAEEIDADSIDWSDSSSTNRIFVRQDPGEENSLGRVKFMFPNQFDIYLHGTPAGHLFALEDRGFSHGCVRVEDPVALASYLLRGQEEGDPERIRAMIESGETQTLHLEHPMPVHIVYFTAFVEEDGAVGFREDIYGIDRELIEELRGMKAKQQQVSSGTK
jgi:murein L,D-transpeptidase YcbB/YkuD